MNHPIGYRENMKSCSMCRDLHSSTFLVPFAQGQTGLPQVPKLMPRQDGQARIQVVAHTLVEGGFHAHASDRQAVRLLHARDLLPLQPPKLGDEYFKR